MILRLLLFIATGIACNSLLAETTPGQLQPEHGSDTEHPIVTVMEPYIDLRTGPGRGYPIFHVVEAKDEIKIIKQRTNWFLVETTARRPVRGWAHLENMQQTAASVTPQQTIYASFPGYQRDQPATWQWYAAGGDFGGASAISAAVIYQMTENFKLVLEGSQILGEFSDGKMLNATIQHYPFPQWRISPYVQLGAGVLQTEPSATLVQAEDRRDNTLSVGGGINIHLSQRFNLFMDYRRYTVLTTRDQNEEIDQWHLGINVSL
ncbi:MAG: hypothetical protein ACE37D_18840 [Pseudomonadales bacterium]